MTNRTEKRKLTQSGKVLVPAILWMMGVPLTLVVILWALFFRG